MLPSGALLLPSLLLLAPAPKAMAPARILFRGTPDDLKPSAFPASVPRGFPDGSRTPQAWGELMQRFTWTQQDGRGRRFETEVDISVYLDGHAGTRLYGPTWGAFSKIEREAMKVLFDGYFPGQTPTSRFERITVLGSNIAESEIGLKRNGVMKQRRPQDLMRGEQHFLEWTSRDVNSRPDALEFHHKSVQAGNVFIHVKASYPVGERPRLAVGPIVEELLARVTGSSAPVAPATQATLTLARAEGNFDQGLGLDGRSRLELVARLKGADGRPLAGVPVVFAVNEEDLPQKGRLAPLRAVTDAEGAARAAYHAPKLSASSQGMRTLGFRASAHLPGGAPLEARENCRAYAQAAYTFQMERAGFAPAQPIVRFLALPRHTRLQGRVESAPGGGVPVAGALVIVKDPTGREIGRVRTDGEGQFTLAVQPGEGAPRTEVLEAPLRLEALDAELEAQVRKARSALEALGRAPYGFEASRLLQALDREWPRRFALAVQPGEQQRLRESALRAGLLAVALRESHDAGQRAARAFVISSQNVLQGLVELGDPFRCLDRYKPLSGYREELEAAAANLRALGPRPRLTAQARELLHKTRLVALDALFRKVEAERARAGLRVAEGMGTDQLKGFLLERSASSAGGQGLSEALEARLMAPFRTEIQAALDRQAISLGRGGSGAPLARFRGIYAELAEKNLATARKVMHLETGKAALENGYWLASHAAVAAVTVTTAGQGTVKALEVKGASDKAERSIRTGLDGYQGALHYLDLAAAREALGRFVRAAQE